MRHRWPNMSDDTIFSLNWRNVLCYLFVVFVCWWWLKMKRMPPMKRHVPEMSLFESATEYSQHPRKVDVKKRGTCVFLRAAVERCCARNTRRIIIISTEKQRRSAVTQCVTSDLKLTIVSRSSRIKNNFEGENFMGQGFDFIPRKKKRRNASTIFSLKVREK